MDFPKTFDSVPHKRLFSKVEALSITDKVHAWITDFLSDRTQTIVVNSAESQKAAVTSGIPQGIVIGHELFLMYINDIPLVVKNLLRLFADDIKIYASSEVDGATKTV